MQGFVLCDRADQVHPHVAAGDNVVFMVRSGEAVDLAGMRRGGPGRVAVFVADPEEREGEEAATAMGAELFG